MSYPYEVFMKVNNDGRLYNEVKRWCEQNCGGKFVLFCAWQAEFEIIDDAFAFKLRWS